MKAIINKKPCMVNLEYRVENLKGQWSIWSCCLEFDDGSLANGTIQSDGHMCAPETFEDDES